ncbi:MAG: M23 family metallopeptidase [Aquificaceae bacterium]
MRYRYRIERRRKKRFALLRFIRKLAIFSLVLILFYTLFLFFDGKPQISEESLKSLSLIAKEKSYSLSFDRPVKELRLYIQEDGEQREIYKADFPKGVEEVSFVLNAKDLNLKDGEVNLFLEVSSGFLSKKTYSIKALVDTVPPRVRIIAYTSSPMLGGSAVIKVQTEEGAEVYVIQGDYRYPLYSTGKGYYFGLFPIRLEGEDYSLVAKDMAGNEYSQALNLRIRVPKFKVDKILIDDDFINKVIYPLLGQEGKDLEPLEAFKRVNETWRKRDIKKVEEIGRKSEPRILWEGAFIQLPRSKVLATYGDIRHYYYEGQKVSESRHMGIDLASLKNSPVPASNSGVVVFVGDMGIYGTTVIIDHGMGLMSLYGHLSEVSVREGQFVKKGEVIGKTGKTGLALGDHLHFGILVHGYEVNPIEWFDPKWIRNNVQAILEAR